MESAPHPKSPETLPVGERALAHVVGVLRERFETGPVENRLMYHNSEHTKGVVENVKKIGTALELTPRELALAEIAASFHDVVQQWKPLEKGGGSTFRKRDSGANEKASYEEAVAWMKNESGQEWAEEDIAKVRDAILSTTPAWSPELRTVVQDMLTHECDSVLRAVAMADLSVAGMNPEMGVANADQLFMEEQLDAVEALRQYKAGTLPEEKAAQVVARYKNWIEGQWNFIDGRRQRLEIELGDIPVHQKEAMRELFSRYDDSLRVVVGHQQKIQGWSFADFAQYVEPYMKKIDG